MELRSSELMLLLLASLLYFGPAYFGRIDKFIYVLKSEFPRVFDELGSPSGSFFKSSVADSSAILIYVLKREYRALGNDVITDLGNSARLRLLIPLVLFISITFLAFYERLENAV